MGQEQFSVQRVGGIGLTTASRSSEVLVNLTAAILHTRQARTMGEAAEWV